ncbi:MAG: FtsX-like permease family protein [Verrucomicrobia bacterium]|nr:FtsX-like permease family protein [Verrucomicrobiota bacterium]
MGCTVGLLSNKTFSNAVRLVVKSLRQHALSTSVTAASIALAGGLLMAVWVVKSESQKTFTGVTGGFDAVLGARSSQLQLVLNSIFHLEASPGNLANADYLDLKKDTRVALAVPIAVGDNFHGYRLVGTTTEMLTDVEFAPGKKFKVREGGRVFDPNLREAVVGSFAARKLGLKYGDTFQPFHGLIFNERDKHEEEYVVVGVLEPSNTPADRVIWISLAGIQNMAGHDPKTATDVSAVLVKLRSPIAGKQLELMYNKQGNRLTFAWPIAQIMAQLFDKIGWMDRVLALIAYLVALVATGSVLASIYNSMNERRREIAILRALGARRGTIFSAVVLESAAISAIGMAVAFGIYGVIVSVVAAVIREQTGVVIDPLTLHPVLLLAPAGMIALGALAGVVPAWKAYRTDVAENLVPVS